MAGASDAPRLLISNEYSNKRVHQWRSEEAGILVGTNTALQDDPELTNRLWTGPSPVRLLLDMDLRLPASLKLFNGQQKTIIFNSIKSEEHHNMIYYRLDKNKSLISQLMEALYQLKIQSVLVEGGQQLLDTFIQSGCWDEARVITNKSMETGAGLVAPGLKNAVLHLREQFLQDELLTWLNASDHKNDNV